MRKLIIKKLFKNFIKENSLNIRICFKMPLGFETSFGNFDNTRKILYLNINKNFSDVRILFTLYHELRHCYQYNNLEKFNKIFQKSLNYVVLFNGDCYKLINQEWKSCSLLDKNYNFLEIYKNLPYEIDANKFASKMTKAIIKEKDFIELESIYKNSMPNKIMSEEKLQKIFNEIDILCN